LKTSTLPFSFLPFSPAHRSPRILVLSASSCLFLLLHLNTIFAFSSSKTFLVSFSHFFLSVHISLSVSSSFYTVSLALLSISILSSFRSSFLSSSRLYCTSLDNNP
jgi:hypothetical protein